MSSPAGGALGAVQMTQAAIAPGAWLGLLGGGQLGRMFAMAAQSLGFRVAVLDPLESCPASSVSDLQITADYLDAEGLERLAGLCAAVTTEFENVPAQSLRFLGEHGVVSPAADSVAIAQDRIAEKAFIASCGLAVASHVALHEPRDLDGLDAGLFPGILKASRLGYDGKGQARVATLAEARGAFAAMGGVPSVLEKRLSLAYELSVVVARGEDGYALTYPVAENLHREGILAVSTIPSVSASEAISSAARAAALRIAEALEYVGVLCVEFFVLSDGALLVNEIAPRPHNSGHFSIDACVTSQFEQQVRTLTRLPLGSTHQHSCAIMLNLLGDLWFRDGTSSAREPDWRAVLAIDGACLHLYGKTEARLGRKMGHVTVLGERQQDVRAKALAIAHHLGVAPWP